jgi:hypothetical protein
LIKDMPLENPGWVLYVAGTQFAENPSSANLASSLAWLAEKWEPDNFHPYIEFIPWPLHACINATNSKEDLEQFAVRAAAGDFGDRESWLAAEQRWVSRGITNEDLEYLDDEKWPYNKSIAEIGFPFVSYSLDISNTSKSYSEGVEQLLSIYRSIGEGKRKEWVANTYISMHFSNSQTQ